MNQLTAKQSAFVNEYMLDLNATQAAIRAGYSEKTAQEQGSRLLSNVIVGKAIAVNKEIRANETGIDAEWLLNRLAVEAQADLSDIYDESGDILPLKDWPLIWRQGLVSGIKTAKIGDSDQVTITEIKISDRIKRLELIGKHIDVSAFIDKVVEKQIVVEDMTDLEAARRMVFLLQSATQHATH